MAKINKAGQSISYECSELIAELKADIQEFGNEKYDRAKMDYRSTIKEVGVC